MGVWYGDEYYTFPEVVEYGGFRFRFDRVVYGEPEYVYRGENLQLRTKDFRKFTVETVIKKKIIEVRDIEKFDKLDRFFRDARVVIVGFNSYVLLAVGGSEYFVKIYPGKCTMVTVSDGGLVRVAFDFMDLPDVFREPEKYVERVLLDLPGELIMRVKGKDDETIVYFRNGAHVTVTNDGKVLFFGRVSRESVKRIATSDDFVVLSGLIEEKRVDIRTSYDGDYVGLVKRLIEMQGRLRVLGPLVRVDGRQVITPRGFVTLAGKNPVVDDEVLRAIKYVFGRNNDFRGWIGVVLDDKYSKIILRNAERGNTIYRVGDRVFWGVDEGVLTNGKYALVRGVNVGKNRVPLNVPVRRRVLERIENNEDVLPGDVLPGMSDDAVLVETGSVVGISTKKKTAVSRIEFGPEGVVYRGLPYVTGVAVVGVPWEYDGDVLSVPVPPEDLVVDYLSLYVRNGIWEYERMKMVSKKSVVVYYPWGHVFINGRYVTVKYRGRERSFDHMIAFDDEEQLFVLLHFG